MTGLLTAIESNVHAIARRLEIPRSQYAGSILKQDAQTTLVLEIVLAQHMIPPSVGFKCTVFTNVFVGYPRWIEAKWLRAASFAIKMSARLSITRFAVLSFCVEKEKRKLRYASFLVWRWVRSQMLTVERRRICLHPIFSRGNFASHCSMQRPIKSYLFQAWTVLIGSLTISLQKKKKRKNENKKETTRNNGVHHDKTL